MTAREAIVTILILLLGSGSIHGQAGNLEVKNSFTAQGVVLRGDFLPEGMAQFAWKPELFGEYYFRPDLRLAAELSLDNRLELLFGEPQADPELNFGLYRAWAAAAWKSTELKAGLQHIRMGVAQIYRPLQWFDDLVPGAFLPDTKGVMALNLSHFFPNPELRIWALPGTGERIGSQEFATREGTWEYGGRVGVSSSWGESGLSFDLRETDFTAQDSIPISEYRFGLDQRVDGFMGGWLEAELSVLDDELWSSGQNGSFIDPRYRGAATLGGDYTFGLGNGLYALAELSLLWKQQNHGLAEGKLPGFTSDWRGALMLNYPLGLLDSLVLLGTYNNGSAGRYNASLSWRRTYDKLSWDLSLAYDSANPLSQASAAALSLTINYDI